MASVASGSPRTGKRLAALGYDGNVHLADARTGDEVLVLRTSGPPAGGGGFTPRLAFSPDGSRIAANAADRSLNLWDLGPASGLAVEPEAGDLAGWLRRSRALAERGDVAAAEAAAARARDIKGRDASPWIEHAAWLYRRGDSARARDALARAMEALPDDPGRMARPRPAGSAHSAGRRSRRRSWRRPGPSASGGSARAPDDEAAAAALAELLPDADAAPGWTVLRPDVMTSAAGATLTRLPDGSVLAGGPNPPVDTYTDRGDDRPVRDHRTAARGPHRPEPAGPRARAAPRASGNFFLTSIRLAHRRRAVRPGPGRA